MAFDPFTWGLGFALNRLTARVLKTSGTDELQEKLRNIADQWAKQLPASASTHSAAIFSEAAADPDTNSRPARFSLQEALCSAGVVPTQNQWADAFIEHWDVKRAELGERANAFFQLSRNEATTHLCDLAGRLHRGFAFDRLDHRGHRFSISISSDDEWSVHAESLRDFVQNASSVIADAKRMGVTVEADAAIGPEDLRGKPYLSCSIPSATIKELEQNGVELTFTVYPDN